MASFTQRLAHVIAAIPVSVRILSAAPLLAFLAATTACSNTLPAAPSTSSASQQSPRILLSPGSASVSSGAKLQFTALIRNSSNTQVHWFTTAGTISTDGLFYAPTVTSAQTVTVSVGSEVRPGSPDHHADFASTSVIVTPADSLSISTHDLRAATVGVSYSEPVSSGGGTPPYSWSISSGALPQGMQLNASTGVISGSTGKTGNFSFTVTVKDASSNHAAQALAFTVSGSSDPCVSGPPTYSCSTTSTANPGRISPIFTSTAPTPASCSGMCQNSTAYDTTLNPAGTDCITRITDPTTFANGQSMGNLTFSGGDNDIMGSVNETYLGVTTGGAVYILHMTANSNGCAQVVNTGIPAIHVAGPFGFSKVTDNVFYYLVNETQLWQGTITSDTTWTQTELYDITGTTGGFTQCPGVNWGTFGTPNSASVMGISQNDGRFGWSVGTNGQGSADWEFVWDRTLGCAAVNYKTGSYWNFTTTGSASTPPTGTLSTASGTCWGSLGSSLRGIHDSQMSGDGNYMVTTISGGAEGGWAQGSCADSIRADQFVTWQIGTGTTQWLYGASSLGVGGPNAGAHASAGVTHYLTPYFGGPNIRFFSNVASYTTFLPTMPVSVADSHQSWPHPFNDDSYPWVGASDEVPVSQGGPIAPNYLGNVIFAIFPNITDGPIVQFTHTFSCNEPIATNCPGGADAGFGAQNSVGFATQKGNYFCWGSTHLQSLGNDNLGNPRDDGFCVHLQ